MLKVKLTVPGPWPLERQTPGGRGVWQGVQFFINRPVEKCDYWIVCEPPAVNSTETEETICPRENLIFISCEPPTIREYNEQFLSQFAAVITCHKNIAHKNPIFQHQGYPWHIGRRQKNHINLSWSKDYDELAAMREIPKTKSISIICSAKTFSRGHSDRFAFAKKLKKFFGNEIDLFGREINEIEDKWDALAPYKYHVAIENSYVEEYWTEKLSDPFLAGCYPLYYGCPNIERYFDNHAFTKININKPKEAFQTISKCLDESRYEKAAEALKTARHDILNKYNIFSMICEFISQRRPVTDQTKYVRTQITPEVRVKKKWTAKLLGLRSHTPTWREQARSCLDQD